jgi:SsrA-binding protein
MGGARRAYKGLVAPAPVRSGSSNRSRNPLRATPIVMARPRPPEFDKKKIVAENRRARFEYFLEEFFEAGIALTGTEVKSLRFGEGSIAESYAEVKDGQASLVNANIPEFSHGNRFNHEPKRPRK